MKCKIFFCIFSAVLLNALVLVVLSKCGFLLSQIGNRDSKCSVGANYVSQLKYLCTEEFTPPEGLSGVEEISLYYYNIRGKPVSNIIVNCAGEYLKDLEKMEKENLFFLDYSPNPICVNYPYGVPKSILRDNLHLLSVPLVLIPCRHQFGAAEDDGEFAAKTRRFVFLHNIFVAYMLSNSYFSDRPRSAYTKVGDLIYWRTTWDGFFLRFLKHKTQGNLMILGKEPLVGRAEDFFPPDMLDQVEDEWPPPQREHGAVPPLAPNPAPPPSPTIKADGDGERDGEAKQ